MDIAPLGITYYTRVLKGIHQGFGEVPLSRILFPKSSAHHILPVNFKLQIEYLLTFSSGYTWLQIMHLRAAFLNQ